MYVFRLDCRHMLNGIIQEKMPHLQRYRLNCVQGVDEHISYLFYYIPNPTDLNNLFEIFYDWLDAVTVENIDD
jgi:hypothetical protein